MWEKADQFDCISCGGSADEWAYDGTDPTEVVNDAGQRYSQWPEFYMPLCLPCHRSKDLGQTVGGRTHCKSGHEWAVWEWIMPSAKGKRRCKACWLEWKSKRENG